MTETKLVYRMEEPDGTGAFQGVDIDAFGNTMIGLGFDDPHITHPAPWEDGLALRHAFYSTPNWVCGCRSKAELRRWFPRPTLPLLDDVDAGYTVWRVPADKVAYGDHQVMFDREEAECIHRGSARDLYQPQKGKTDA